MSELVQYDKVINGEDATIVLIEAIIMPNGEILRYGKSLGFIDENQPKGIFLK